MIDGDGQQFELWIERKDSEYKNGNTDIRPYYDHTFNDLPPSMQWGAYVEFFDGEGLHLSTTYWQTSTYSYDILGRDIVDISDRYDTRAEAQRHAIKKAFKILDTRKR